MNFKINAKAVILLLMTSLGLTLITFFCVRIVDRQIVEKDFPPYVSATVEGRGWPIAYMVDDPKKENFENIGAEDRIFPGAFLADWIILSLIVGGLYYIQVFLKVFLKSK